MGDTSDDEEDMLFICGLGDDTFEDATDDESSAIRDALPVKRVEYASISGPKEFEERFMVPNEPVILTKAHDYLPMHLTTEYLAQRYGDRSYPLNFEQGTKVGSL